MLLTACTITLMQHMMETTEDIAMELVEEVTKPTYEEKSSAAYSALNDTSGGSTTMEVGSVQNGILSRVQDFSFVSPEWNVCQQVQQDSASWDCT